MTLPLVDLLYIVVLIQYCHLLHFSQIIIFFYSLLYFAYVVFSYVILEAVIITIILSGYSIKNAKGVPTTPP